MNETSSPLAVVLMSENLMSENIAFMAGLSVGMIFVSLYYDLLGISLISGFMIMVAAGIGYYLNVIRLKSKAKKGDGK